MLAGKSLVALEQLSARWCKIEVFLGGEPRANVNKKKRKKKKSSVEGREGDAAELGWAAEHHSAQLISACCKACGPAPGQVGRLLGSN